MHSFSLHDLTILMLCILTNLLYIFFQEQIALLKELHWYMENIEFDTLNWFQYGIIVTLRSIIELQLYMKEKLGLPYLLTAHVDQDYHEGFNGQMRGSDGRGGVRNPTHLMLHYRIQRWVTAKILEHPTFCCYDLRETLTEGLKAAKQIANKISIVIPRRLRESEADGMFWAAGFIAKTMKDIQPLGAIEKKATTAHAKNKFTSLINHGGLMMPLKTFLKAQYIY